MMKMVLAVMLLASSAFAQHQVQVKVDGVQYYCSQDPNNGGGSDALVCENSLKRIKQKYNVCTNSHTQSTCFAQILTDVQKNKECGEVVEYCYNVCTNSHTQSTCFAKCYN